MPAQPDKQVLYVRPEEWKLFQKAILAAFEEFNFEPSMATFTSTENTETPLLVIREPGAHVDPDGDALNGFSKPSLPEGLIVRRKPRVPDVWEANGCRLQLGLFGPADARALKMLKKRALKVFPKHVVRKTHCCPSQDKYRYLIRVEVPNNRKLLEEIADCTGASNDENSQKIAPLMAMSVLPIAAAVTIQSAFRSYRARQGLDIRLINAILRRRAVILIQRTFRNAIFNRRMYMLKRVREICSNNENQATLALSKTFFNMLAQCVNSPTPRFLRESRLQFCFDARGDVLVITPDPERSGSKQRRAIPAWVGVDLPEYTRDELTELPFFSTANVHRDTSADILLQQKTEVVDAVSVSSALLGKEAQPGEDETRRAFKIYNFLSVREARRRAALLYFLTFDLKTATGVELKYDGSAVSMKVAFRPPTEERLTPFSPTHKVVLARLPPSSPFKRFSTDPSHKIGLQPDQSPTKKTGVVSWETRKTVSEQVIAKITPARQEHDMTLPFPRPREPTLKGGASPEPRVSHGEPEEELLSPEESAHGRSLVHYGRRSVSPLSGGHMLQEKSLTKEEVQRQAELIRLESQQLMKQKEEQELQEALGLRASIESRLGMSARVVRSANTSSMLCADLTTSNELRQMARDLREEYRRENIAQATQMREETRTALKEAHEEVQRQKQHSGTLRHQEQKELLLKIEDKNIDVEQDVARQVAIRKWQRQRQREMAKDREAIKTFECQHNALSKQMVSAEVRHLQKLDWQYTCREVDARKQLSQMRKHEVALEKDEMRSMRRDAALTRLMQIDQLRARLADEHELEMHALKEKNKKNKTLHEMYAPAVPAGGSKPRYGKTVLKPVSVVSAL